MNKFVTNWDLHDWASFLGAYVGGFITLSGVWWQVTREEKQKEKDEKIGLLKKEQQEQFNIIENQNKEIKIKDFALKFNEIFAKITDEEKIKLLHAFIEDISLDIETIKISEKRNKYKIAIRDVNFK